MVVTPSASVTGSWGSGITGGSALKMLSGRAVVAEVSTVDVDV